MVKVLAPEASACQHISCCSIASYDIQLLIKGTEWEALDSTFVVELCIIAQNSCPVETLIQVPNVMPIVGELQVPVGIEAKKSIFI